MFSRRKYRRAGKSENEEEFGLFCHYVLKINIGLSVIAFLAALIFSLTAAGGSAFRRYHPVLPGTGAWAYSGTGFGIGNQPAAETNRDLNGLMQGDEQAANNQVPENAVNTSQGENIVNPQANPQAPEGVVNGGQPENIMNAPIPEGYVDGAQTGNVVNGQAPGGYVNGGQPQSPVDEEEAIGRAKNPAALRSQKAAESGVSIIYIAACTMIVAAAWALMLQDTRSGRHDKKKNGRRRKSAGWVRKS